jgi:hypothetical protein
MPLFKRSMSMFPDVGKLTGDLTAKFDQLIAEIRALGVKLDAILTAVQPKQ